MRRGTTAVRWAVTVVILTVVCSVTAVAWSPPTAWAHTPHDTTADVVLSPDFGRDGTVYAISRLRILRSTDGGDTWATLTRGLQLDDPPTSLAVSAADPSVVYVSSRGDGVFRSADRGETWQQVVGGLELHLGIAWVAASPADPDVAFAAEGYGGGLFRTIDGGRSWSATGIGAINSLAVDPDHPSNVVAGDGQGSLHRSEDGGATWAAPVALTPGRAIRTLAVGPAPSSVVLAGTDGRGVLLSRDGGRSFRPAATQPSDPRVRDIALSPDFGTDHQVWATTWAGGACRSNDAGETWACSAAGLDADAQADELHLPQFQPLTVAARAQGDRTLFLGSWAGLYRSVDAGATWEELETQAPENITSLAVAAGRRGTTTLVLSTYLNGVLISDDQGDTWRAANDGLATRLEWSRRRDYFSRVIGITASPGYADDGELFASQRGFVLHASDRGRSWTPMLPPGVINTTDHPPDYFCIALSPDYPEDHLVILGSNRGKVYRSTTATPAYRRAGDLGAEITALVASPNLRKDGFVLAATVKGLRRSTDRAVTWERAGELPSPVTSLTLSPDFGHDATVFAGTDDGLFVSTDRATSWTQVRGAAFPDDAYIESVVPSPAYAEDQTVLASVRGLGLMRSTDGAVTFAPVGRELLSESAQVANWYHPTSEPIVFSPDFARDRTVYGFGGTALYRSGDGGTTWSAVPFPLETHDTRVAAAPGPLLALPEVRTGVRGASPGPGSATSVEEPAAPDHRVEIWAVGGLGIVVAASAAWFLARRRRTRARTA